MNLNLLAYLIYALITLWTIVVVGKDLNTNGRPYISQLFQEDDLTDFLNNGLLAGYYLFNMGYVVLTLDGWPRIDRFELLITEIGERSGTILILLGIMHFVNIAWLQLFAWYKQGKLNSFTNFFKK